MKQLLILPFFAAHFAYTADTQIEAGHALEQQNQELSTEELQKKLVNQYLELRLGSIDINEIKDTRSEGKLTFVLAYTRSNVTRHINIFEKDLHLFQTNGMKYINDLPAEAAPFKPQMTDIATFIIQHAIPPVPTALFNQLYHDHTDHMVNSARETWFSLLKSGQIQVHSSDSSSGSETENASENECLDNQ